ncbi:unnamed protein product [Amoebophrya sp. A25]|nr:unnamed protein product [Amoebophrya sp. A25]|eukprot:GSA25T00026900001.1
MRDLVVVTLSTTSGNFFGLLHARANSTSSSVVNTRKRGSFSLRGRSSGFVTNDQPQDAGPDAATPTSPHHARFRGGAGPRPSVYNARRGHDQEASTSVVEEVVEKNSNSGTRNKLRGSRYASSPPKEDAAREEDSERQNAFIRVHQNVYEPQQTFLQEEGRDQDEVENNLAGGVDATTPSSTVLQKRLAETTGIRFTQDHGQDSQNQAAHHSDTPFNPQAADGGDQVVARDDAAARGATSNGGEESGGQEAGNGFSLPLLLAVAGGGGVLLLLLCVACLGSRAASPETATARLSPEGVRLLGSARATPQDEKKGEKKKSADVEPGSFTFAVADDKDKDEKKDKKEKGKKSDGKFPKRRVRKCRRPPNRSPGRIRKRKYRVRAKGGLLTSDLLVLVQLPPEIMMTSDNLHLVLEMTRDLQNLCCFSRRAEKNLQEPRHKQKEEGEETVRKKEESLGQEDESYYLPGAAY